jgi:predicted glycosyltransferase
MVFDDVTRDDPYDLVIADEGWEIDHFLHENPGCKRSAFAWLTDFVGWLPMPAGGDRERHLAADLNAQMLDQVARLPRVRDRAVFVGDPDDAGPGSFGPGLPQVRDWTAGHYAFSGYVAEPQPPVNRAELGYREDERVCLVTVGGSAVGRHLLMRVLAAAPEMARRVPGLRMVVVTGPRIDPRTVAAPPGVEVRGWVPDLDRHLAACDVAVVQGGLATTMELTAARRPFVYVPVGEHFEQNVHVRHRLERHRAGRRLPYAACDPERLAAAVATEVDRPLDYLPVPTDGAERAATLLAELI